MNEIGAAFCVNPFSNILTNADKYIWPEKMCHLKTHVKVSSKL